MSNKRLVRHFIDLTWNQGRYNIAKSLLRRDFTYQASMIDEPMNFDGMVTLINSIKAAMEDFSVSVEEILAEGDRVVTQSTFSGTLMRPLLGFAPSDRLLSLTAVTFWSIAHGRIVDAQSQLDIAELTRHIQRSRMRFSA
jgi:steroid delta-isomerase-like uncharacterized protein